jgi:hypothetical protein
LLKQTTRDHADHDNLVVALEHMKQTVSVINETKRAAEEAEQTLEQRNKSALAEARSTSPTNSKSREVRRRVSETTLEALDLLASVKSYETKPLPMPSPKLSSLRTKTKTAPSKPPPPPPPSSSSQTTSQNT